MTTEEIEKEAADKRWQKRVSARVLGGKIQEFKSWLNTDTGQITLVGVFLVMMIISGTVAKM